MKYIATWETETGTMRTIEEQIKVMQHYSNGGKVEYRLHVFTGEAEWTTLHNDAKFFIWENYIYRIKEAQKTRNMTTEEIAKLDSWKFAGRGFKYPLIISSFNEDGVWFHNPNFPTGNNDYLVIGSFCESCMQYPSMEPFTVEITSQNSVEVES